jgi:hypothetical protein
MKVLIDIQDNKVAKPVPSAKEKLEKKIAIAVKEVNLIDAGKRNGTSAKDFLNAL